VIRPRCASSSRHVPTTGFTADQVQINESADRSSDHTSTTGDPSTNAATATPGPHDATASRTSSYLGSTIPWTATERSCRTRARRPSIEDLRS
jgi:hypothetical protein